MGVLLLNVPLRPKTPLKRFPLGLGYIATAIERAGYQFDWLDIDLYQLTADDIARALHQRHYDVVCLGTIVSGYRRIKEACALIRAHQPHACIVVGNTVASSIPDMLLTRTDADVVVFGEGDVTIVHLLDAIASGTSLSSVLGIAYIDDGVVKRTPERPVVAELDELPFVDFKLFDIDRYIDVSKMLVSDPLPIPRDRVRAVPLSTARGCLYRCTFCYFVFEGTPYRVRSAKNVVDEMAQLQDAYGINYAIFDDELTFFNKKQTLEFADTIIDSGIEFHWVANCRAGLFDRDEDLEIIRRLKRAGCHGLRYSLESADPEILKQMRKPLSLKGFRKQTALLHEAGLPAWTSIVIGYPDETPETIARTFDVCVENRIFPSSGFLLPQPGSPMYAYAREHGYIGDEEKYLLGMGDRIDLYLNMTKMSDEELKRHMAAGVRRTNEVAAVSTLSVELSHNGDRHKASEAVEMFVSQLSKWGGAKIYWTEWAGDFAGTGVSGRVEITEDRVDVTVRVGLTAKVAGAAPNTLQQLIDELQDRLNGIDVDRQHAPAALSLSTSSDPGGMCI